MGALTMAAVAEALKSYYLPGLRYQLNEEASPFITQLDRDSESVVGKDIVMALRYGRVGGIGNRSDDGTLPTPNSRKTKQAKWETKNLFARFQISDKTIKASRSSVGAFANMLEQEISDCEIDAKQDISRQGLGDGTGKLATIKAVSGTTLTLKTEADAPGEPGTLYFAEGMLVDIYTGGTLDTSEAEVLLVDHENNQIVVSSATGAAANDVIYLAGNKDLEITGLEAVFTKDNTIYNIDRSTNKWFNPTVIDVNGEISEVVIQQAMDDANRNAGSNINFMMCSFGVRRAYQNLLTAQKQIVKTMELKGGFRALDYNGIPLMPDKYIKPGRLFCLDLKDWKMYEMSDFEWLDEDGGILTRVSNKPVWEATLCKYADIGCSKPKGQVLLKGIAEH